MNIRQQREQPWYAAHGDQTLRLDYPLTEDSVVMDIGGYRGEWAEAIYNKYGCNIAVFEPIEENFDVIYDKFVFNNQVHIFSEGLSTEEHFLNMFSSKGESSIYKNDDSTILHDATETVSLLDAVSVFNMFAPDLVKINIEGMEFDILPYLLENGCTDCYYQIQFHDFVSGAEEKRAAIRETLSKTHTEQWCYDWVWESWKPKVK